MTKYQMIFNTVVFDKEKIKSHLAEDPIFITIMRSPVKHFLSTYYFYYDKFTSREMFTSRGHSAECWGSPFYPYLKRIHATPDSFLEKLQTEGWEEQTPYKFRGQNFQSFELGLDFENNSPEYIKESVTSLVPQFDLALITDYFTESLLLLKRRLCLSWVEMFATAKMVQKYSYRKFESKVRELLMNTHRLDSALFWQFNQTFWHHVQYKYRGGIGGMKEDIGKLDEVLK